MRCLAFLILLAGVAHAQQLTKPPKLTHFVRAETPPDALTGSTVTMLIDVDDTGKVTRVQLKESGGEDFDEAALAAAAQFEFEPAEVDNVPAAVQITYDYVFTPRTARLDGVVRDRDSNRVLAGAEVRAGDFVTTTDDTGRFVFYALLPGTVTVELRAPGYDRASVTETLAPSESRTVSYALAPPTVAKKPRPFESTVRVRVRRDTVETTVSTDEARKVAGTNGDALQVVRNLPGVARASFGQGQLVVWGSAPADTHVYVDDVEVPSLYHVGGLRSTVNDALVRDLTFSPGAYGAAYGRGLGGLVRLETRPLAERGVHGYAAADLLDASALLEAAVGTRLRIAIAGRYSYLDKILGGIVNDVGDYFPIPRWDDYQLKATLALRRGEELALTFLGADDRLDRSVSSSDPAHARTERTEQSSYRLFLRYSFGDTVVTPFFGFDHSRAQTRFGATPTDLTVDNWRYGLRAYTRRRVRAWLLLQLGLDVQGTRSGVMRFGSLTLPPREGDIYVFGQPPAGDLASDRFSTDILDAAPYASADLTFGRVTITPGLRIGAVLIQGDHLVPQGLNPVPGFSRLDWAPEPRLAVSVRAHRRVDLQAAAGLYHQAPDPVDLSAVFGNPLLDLERAWHVTAGLRVRATETLDVEATGFFKQLDDLVTRSPLPAPPVGDALVQDGSGRSYGGQVLVRNEPWRGVSGWVSYTVSRSERQDHPGAPVRLFDYDQTHVLALVANYAWRGLNVGARFRYTSGFPRTPVTSAFYDARDDQFQPLFGRQNSIRLPDFVQLDLRVEYAFRWKRVGLDLYLDVQNVTYQRNPEEVVYSADFTKRAYITGLPTLGVVGARLGF